MIDWKFITDPHTIFSPCKIDNYIHSIVAIHSTVETNNKITTETRFYITSLPPDPEKLCHAIRSHWAIENILHWSLDMTFLNDQNRSRKDNAPANIMILQHISINILQHHKPKKGSLAGFRKTLGWNDSKIKNILNDLSKMLS